MDLVTSEAVVRLTAFAISLALLAVVEAVVPRRRRTIARQHRWMGNLGLVVVDTILLRALVFLSATAMAALAEARGWGLLQALGLLPIGLALHCLLWSWTSQSTCSTWSFTRYPCSGASIACITRTDPVELNRNFGFTLSWWDGLFGTYRAQPVMGQEGMALGVVEFQVPDVLSLGLLLIQPFRREPDPRQRPAVREGVDLAEVASGSTRATGKVPLEFANTHAHFVNNRLTSQGVAQDPRG